MSTEILKNKTIVGTDAQFAAHKDSYEEGTIFESTSPIGKDDIDPDYTNSFVLKEPPNFESDWDDGFLYGFDYKKSTHGFNQTYYQLGTRPNGIPVYESEYPYLNVALQDWNTQDYHLSPAVPLDYADSAYLASAWAFGYPKDQLQNICLGQELPKAIYSVDMSENGNHLTGATPDSVGDTIALRDSQGRISAAEPVSDSQVTNKAYVDSKVEAIYKYLGQLAIGGVTVEDTYRSRITAGGLSLLDGAPTRLHTIKGHTRTWGVDASAWLSESTTKYGVTMNPDSGNHAIAFTGIPTGSYKDLIVFPQELFEDGISYTFQQDEHFGVGGVAHTVKNSVYWKIVRTNLITGAIDYSYRSTGSADASIVFDKTLYKYHITITNGSYSYSSGDEMVIKLALWVTREEDAGQRPDDSCSGLKDASFGGVTSTSKNAIDLSREGVTTNGLTISCNNNTYTVNGVATSGYQDVFDTEIPASWAGKTITLSQSPTSSNWNDTGLYMLLYSVPFKQIAGSYTESRTVTLQEGVTYRLCIRNVNNTTTDYAGKTFKFMVNFGSTALPYEDYVSDAAYLSSTLNLGEWDYIDIDRQKAIYQTGKETKTTPITSTELANFKDGYILSADAKTVAYKLSTPIELDISMPKDYKAWTNGTETVTMFDDTLLPTITQTYYEEIG